MDGEGVRVLSYEALSGGDLLVSCQYGGLIYSGFLTAEPTQGKQLKKLSKVASARRRKESTVARRAEPTGPSVVSIFEEDGDLSSEDDRYIELVRITKARRNKGRAEFLTEWKGSSSGSTWEPEDAIPRSEVKKFLKANPEARAELGMTQQRKTRNAPKKRKKAGEDEASSPESTSEQQPSVIFLDFGGEDDSPDDSLLEKAKAVTSRADDEEISKKLLHVDSYRDSNLKGEELQEAIEAGEFRVEVIEDFREPNKQRQEVLIKWAGFGPSENTWEPLTNLSDDLQGLVRSKLRSKRRFSPIVVSSSDKGGDRDEKDPTARMAVGRLGSDSAGLDSSPGDDDDDDPTFDVKTARSSGKRKSKDGKRAKRAKIRAGDVTSSAPPSSRSRGSQNGTAFSSSAAGKPSANDAGSQAGSEADNMFMTFLADAM